MRIEDIDSPRVKLWAVQQAIEDLKWLGLDWDEGPDIGGPNGPYLQTQRRDRYQQALAMLRASERIYPCTCSRTDVASAASAPHVGQEGPRYPGLCADRRTAHATQLHDRSYSWRFRTSDAIREFVDRVAGRQICQVSRELGDFVVGKADGLPAYQLAVVVDDHAMGVTEVLRGDDLLPSAFRQLELYDFFGWTPPAFAHVPLVIGADGRRLAKRHGDSRLAMFRARGIRAEQLLGVLAHSCRLLPAPVPISAAELLAEFSLSRLPRQPFVFAEDSLPVGH